MSTASDIYTSVAFRSPESDEFFEAWPGIHNFQAGAVWTIYLTEPNARRRSYDVFYGDLDALTEWMAGLGFYLRMMEGRL